MKRWIMLIMIGCMGEAGYKGVERIEGGKEYNVYIDKNFGGREVKEIELGIGEWNEVLNGRMEIVVVSKEFDMEVEILERLGDRDWLILKKEWEGGELGYVDRVGGGIIWLNRGGREKGVVMHEIGHLMGLEHGKGIMRKRYSGYECIGRDVVEELERLLGERGLRYCD
jgi:hypothetical protein